MAEVDGDGPIIEIQVKTEQAQKDIKSLDKVTAQSVDNMNKQFNTFKENVQKIFSDLKNGGGVFSHPSVGGGGNSASQNVARQSQEQQYKARMIEFERHAIRQRNSQIENGKQLLSASKNMTLALAGLAGVGFGAKAMLDFAHNIGQLHNFLQTSNSNATNALAYRNEFKKRSVDENMYWGAYQNVATTIRNIQVDGSIKNQNQAWAYNNLSAIDPSIQLGFKKGGKIKTDERFKQLVNAYQTLSQKNPRQLSDETITQIGMEIFGGDLNFVQAAKKGLHISKAEMAKARKEANAIPELIKLDAAKQELATTFETERAKFIASVTPMAIDFIKALTNFTTNHGSLLMAGTALAGFSSSILGFLGVLKLAKGILPGVGGFATRGGVASSLWKGTRWAGGKVWDGTKWVAAKGVEAGEWVGKHPGEIVKTGGKGIKKLAGGVIYDLTLGNITDAKSTAAYDEPIRDIHGNLSRAGRKYEIEKAVNGHIGQDFWNNKFYVQTKGGVYVYIDDQFYEPIEQIKRRLRNGQRDVNQPNYHSNDGLLGALFPSAKAHELSRDVQSNYHVSGKGNVATDLDKARNVKKIYDYLTTKGGLTSEQAIGELAGIKQESQFDFNAIGDHGKAFGPYQWREARQAQFKKLYGIDIRQASFEQMMDFRTWEMNNTYKKAGNSIKSAKTASEAAIAHTILYEQPANKELRARERVANIPDVRRLLKLGQQPSMTQHPNLSQIEARVKANRIHNETRNTTNNNGGNTAHNNATINIHVANGTVENIKNGVRQGLSGFPDAGYFNGLSGVT